MRSIIEAERETVVTMDVDVVVSGGGPAGIGAALAASRNGAETLLMERYGFLGGLATAGLVVTLPPPPLKGCRGYGGVLQELIERLYGLGAACQLKEGELDGGLVIFHPEVFKFVADEMMAEAGVKLLYNTLAVNAIVEGNVVRGVVLENKSGRQAITAQVVVDTTGDGDVAAAAGAPYEKELRENLLPMTLMYLIGGVNNEEAREYQDKDPGLVKAAEEAGFTYHTWWPTYRRVSRGPSFVHLDKITRGQVVVWSGSVKADGTDILDLTRAEVELRKQVMAELGFLKKYIPGFESSYIAATAPYIGVRETRRIVGEYVLTEKDLRQKRVFEDAVEWYADPRNPDVVHNVPYRCLVPKGVDNLLVAGRCFSATHEAQNLLREIHECMPMGQAAGTAAALAARFGVKPRRLDVSLLRETLVRQGVYVEKPSG